MNLLHWGLLMNLLLFGGDFYCFHIMQFVKISLKFLEKIFQFFIYFFICFS